MMMMMIRCRRNLSTPLDSLYEFCSMRSLGMCGWDRRDGGISGFLGFVYKYIEWIWIVWLFR